MTRHTTLFAIALIALTSISLNNARFLDTTATATSTSAPSTTPLPSNLPLNVTYASNLSCGLCTMGGFVFCVTGNDAQIYTTAPTQYCCKNSTNCSYVNNTAYTCTNSYADQAYSLYTCPMS